MSTTFAAGFSEASVDFYPGTLNEHAAVATGPGWAESGHSQIIEKQGPTLLGTE
jgi:hypothetical protein